MCTVYEKIFALWAPPCGFTHMTQNMQTTCFRYLFLCVLASGSVDNIEPVTSSYVQIYLGIVRLHVTLHFGTTALTEHAHKRVRA